MRILSLARVHVRLGEALRLEMTDPTPGQEDTVHLQYYIATEMGPWALWLSCARADLDRSETMLRELAEPSSESP